MTQSIAWSDIDRWEYTTEIAWRTSIYLYGLDYGVCFKVFLGLMALHFLTIIVVKILMVKNIRKDFRKNFFDILVHCLENINFPFPYKDWDSEKHLREALT